MDKIIQEKLEIKLPLMIFLVIRKFNQNIPKALRKKSTRYFFYFLKLHFSILFGKSSLHFGRIANRFSLFLDENKNEIFSNESTLLINLLDDYFIHAHEEAKLRYNWEEKKYKTIQKTDKGKLIWISSSEIERVCGKKGELELSEVASLNLGFTQKEQATL